MNLNCSVIAQSNIICLLIANIFPESNTLNFLEILFWLTNTLNNIVALFHKVVFVYKVNWIENELASILWHEEINPSISEVAFFSFDKKMKMFKMRIFTIVPCCFQNIAKSYMTCNLFSRKNSWNTIFPRNLIASLFLRLFVIPGFIDHHTCTIQLPSLFYDCVL